MNTIKEFAAIVLIIVLGILSLITGIRFINTQFDTAATERESHVQQTARDESNRLERDFARKMCHLKVAAKDKGFEKTPPEQCDRATYWNR